MIEAKLYRTGAMQPVSCVHLKSGSGRSRAA